MSDVMTGSPVAQGSSTSTGIGGGMGTLTVVRQHHAAGSEHGAAGTGEWGPRDDRLRRRELLLHHLEIQRRRRARRSA